MLAPLLQIFVLCFGLFGVVLVFNWALAQLAERLAPPRGGFVEVAGLRLHVVDTGEKPGQAGPPLVFVHGLMGQLGHFYYKLLALFPERRVILLDRPGSGYSQAAKSQSLPAQADLVAATIAALRLHKPLVVGHSFGGAVALRLALDHPNLLCGLALVAPLTHEIKAPPGVFAGLVHNSAFGRWLYAWTIGPLTTIAHSQAATRYIFGPDAAPVDFWNKAGGILALRPGNFIAGSRDLVGLRRELPLLEQAYGSLAQKTFILFGKQDHVLDFAVHGEALRDRAPQAELTLVAGGHMLPVTQPETTAAFIRAALTRLGCG